MPRWFNDDVIVARQGTHRRALVIVAIVDCQDGGRLVLQGYYKATDKLWWAGGELTLGHWNIDRHLDPDPVWAEFVAWRLTR